MSYIFHLSIPVSDLDIAKDFYVKKLSGKVGRSEADWLDILLWGHQITLQLRPDEVLGPEAQGKRHFGVILPWQEWEDLSSHLSSAETEYLQPPEIKFQSTPQEQAKFYLQDPSYNVIEVKAYKNTSIVTGAKNGEYNH